MEVQIKFLSVCFRTLPHPSTSVPPPPLPVAVNATLSKLLFCSNRQRNRSSGQEGLGFLPSRRLLTEDVQ